MICDVVLLTKCNYLYDFIELNIMQYNTLVTSTYNILYE